MSFGANGSVQIDDAFAGDTATALLAAAVVAPVGAAVTNEFRTVLPEKIDLKLRVTEQTGKQDHRTRLARHDEAEAGRDPQRCRCSCATTAAPPKPCRCR